MEKIAQSDMLNVGNYVKVALGNLIVGGKIIARIILSNAPNLRVEYVILTPSNVCVRSEKVIY